MALLLLTSAAAVAATPLRLTEGEFLGGGSAALPAADAPWQPVSLGDRWRGEREALTHGWYRFHLDLEAAPAELWAVYLPRLNMNAAVYLNGHFLGDGGRFSEPLARNNYRPLYFEAPPALWRAGRNELLVRLASYPRYGALAPIKVGADAQLRPLYERRLLWHIHLPFALFVLSAGIAAFMAVLWALRRQDSRYLWFALSTAALAMFTLHLFLRDIPVPAKLWWWLVYTSLDLWIVCLALFVHRSLELRRPRLERAFFAYAAVAAAINASISIGQQAVVAQYLFLCRLPIVLYLIVLCAWDFRQRRQREALMYGLACTVIVAVGLRDIALRASFQADWQPGWLGWERDMYLSHTLGPGVFIVLGGFLARRFARALNESESMNQVLEQRVAAARSELEAVYAQQRDLERRQVEHATRENIYRDLHDDVGAKLLSLVYRAPDARSADLARSALHDLRDTVSRPTGQAAPLLAVLADWRAECQQRLESAGVGLDWQAPAAVEGQLSAGRISALGRVLREAVSNALRHAAPRQMRIRVSCADGALEMSLEHDGSFSDPAGWSAGRGLSNMQLRLRQLGGGIGWSAAEGWLRTHWRAPLAETP